MGTSINELALLAIMESLADIRTGLHTLCLIGALFLIFFLAIYWRSERARIRLVREEEALQRAMFAREIAERSV